jgi:hypothetical protein
MEGLLGCHAHWGKSKNCIICCSADPQALSGAYLLGGWKTVSEAIGNRDYKKNKNFTELGEQSNWLYEPDGVSWTDSHFEYEIKRNHINALCGYIFINVEVMHTLGAVELDSRLASFDVHGGITYQESEADKRYVIGFDTAHSCDYAPCLQLSSIGGHPSSYKTYEFVRNELLKLKQQILNRTAEYTSKENDNV